MKDQKIKQDICIGTNIRKLRLRAGLTQEQMAAKLQLEGIDVSRSFYSHIECGTYSIRISELLAIRRILNATYKELFEGLE
jgi:transcriptional regulator with XRE-family HTH domain